MIFENIASTFMGTVGGGRANVDFGDVLRPSGE